MSTVGVEVSNDGAPVGREIQPHGLSRLRQRMTDAGGGLSFAQEDDVFAVEARLAPPDAGVTVAGITHAAVE